MTLPKGTTLDHYEITTLLGEGGMGQVYEAVDSRLKRKVAIKVLSDTLANSPEALARFEREAHSLAQFGHPNIVAIFDANATSRPFVVMEYLEGETLRSKLQRGPVPWRRALDIGSSVADGLAAAHAKGIIHRDIKPENVFLTKDGQVKILDFGIARLTTVGGALENASTVPSLTKSGGIVGTVAYMSPEQIRGEELDDTTDIFSLGCVLHEMITGGAPFARRTLSETRKAILNEEPPDIGDPGVPVEVRRIISNCLGKEPGVRFQAARDLSLTLRGVLPASLLFPAHQPAKVRSTAFWRSTAVAFLVAAVLTVGAVVLWPRLRSQPTVKSVAVLPFENLGDRTGDYLSDGLTESIINDLSDASPLRVLPRNSVFRFKRTALDLKEVAGKLTADVLVTGRVVERDGRLHVQAELIDVRNESQIWGHQYDAPASELVRVQREIAEAVAAKLSPAQKSKPPHSGETSVADAYRLYIKGRYYWEQRTTDSLARAIENFEQAIKADPSYALAYTGLADSYILQTFYGGRHPSETYPKALQAATRALELDPSLAEGHTSLAAVKEGLNFDWAGAELEYKRAIQIKGNYVTAHQWYGQHLLSRGRFTEAERELKTAQSLDPYSLKAQIDVASVAAYQQKYDVALAKVSRVLAESPTYEPALELAGWIYGEKGRHADALSSFKKLRDVAGDASGLPLIARELAASGRQREARVELRRLLDLAKNEYVPPYPIASVFVALSEKDQAFAYLDRAFEIRDENLALLKIDPDLIPIRADKRYQRLMERLGL